MGICRAFQLHSKKRRALRGDLIVNGVSHRDVHQDALHDCYFLGPLASWASCDPEAVNRQLVRKLDDGTFVVTLHEDRKAVHIPVDPRSLHAGVLAHGEDPEFVELWPAIIENALIELKGGLAAADFGWADEGLECLTGRPFARLFLEDPAKDRSAAERVWQLLTERAQPPREYRASWESKLTSPAAVTSHYVRAGGVARLLRLRGNSDGVAPRHALAILGVGENRELGRYVIVHDQRGFSRGAVDGGTMRCRLDDFLQQFRWLHISEQPWT
jgi:hypothetical protein